MEKIKTYVVNMERDTHKRKKIESQLIEHSLLNPEIVNAIDGSKLSEDEIEEQMAPMFKSRYKYGATLAALGCSLSHYSIYKAIIEKDIELALVLEDDALLASDLDEGILAVKSMLQSDIPIVILLTPDFNYHTGSVRKINLKLSLCDLKGGVMTSGYLINKSAAKLLSDNIFPIEYLADAWTDFVGLGLQLYGIIPHLVSFPDGLGEIGLSQQRQTSTGLKNIICYNLARTKGFCYKCIVYLRGYRFSKKRW